jgi:hypothetical protein
MDTLLNGQHVGDAVKIEMDEPGGAAWTGAESVKGDGVVLWLLNQSKADNCGLKIEDHVFDVCRLVKVVTLQSQAPHTNNVYYQCEL